MGSSSYGKTITDQKRHREVRFCKETEASRIINTPFYRQIEQIDKETYLQESHQVESSHANRLLCLLIRKTKNASFLF